MSRHGPGRPHALDSFPRVSGDEPNAGTGRGTVGGGFPRVSGDEPLLLCTDKAPTAFSPRERG